MKFNYNIELNNILNNIYEYKVCEIAYKNNLPHISLKNAAEYEIILKNTNVYLGSDLHDFIISLIPNDKSGYYFRCEIANHHNYYFPRLYDYLGNPLKNVTYNKFAIQLWESYMNDLLIKDLGHKFNQINFCNFIDLNLNNMFDKINTYIDNTLNKNKITIFFDTKDDLLDVVKSMIIKKELDLSWAELLVDMDELRSEMTKFSAAFHIYNEFDKLEDNLSYCLNNFCKYDSSQLFDILIQEKGFKFIEKIGLVKI